MDFIVATIDFADAQQANKMPRIGYLTAAAIWTFLAPRGVRASTTLFFIQFPKVHPLHFYRVLQGVKRDV